MMNPRLLAFLFTLSGLAHGQFYAPDTEFHDIAQRTFAVEAARVLAWQQNLDGGKIAEVKFEVQTTPERETIWSLRWLDAAGKSLREKTVRYPEARLVEGAAYFRDVFRQIAGDDWKAESAPPDHAAAAFWQGAGSAGASRLEALEIAGKLLPEQKITRAAGCARFAGTLVHGAMPMMSNSMSLDSVLLARGAAWLCLAETIAGEPFDAAWGPIHFLAGREHVAEKLWTDTRPKAREKQSDPERFWDHQLRTPSIAACFVFAAKRENRAFALPAMMYPHRFDTRWTTLLVDSADELLDGGWKARLYEYAPNISIRGGWQGRQFSKGAASRALSAWLRALQEWKGDPADETKYRAPLAAMRSADGERPPVFAQLAPLLNLGLDQSSAPLIPVGHVTTRDLLSYGWEQMALQFGSVHREMAEHDVAAANELAESALTHLSGVEALFPKAKFTPKHPLADVRRLQFINSSPVRNALRDRALDWRKPADGMFRRRWLMGSANREFETMLLSAATEDELRATVARLRREGGPSAFHGLIEFDKDMKYPEMIDHLGLRLELASEIPWGVTFREMAVKRAFWRKDDPLKFAQTLEKFGWESGVVGGAASDVIAHYLDAGAVAAAKRYAAQVQPFLRERSYAERETLYPLYALAWLENDEAGMASAVAQCELRDEAGADLRVTHALLHGKDKAAAKELRDAKNFSGDDEAHAALAAWLPLAPALRDSLHADHQEAIDSFPREHTKWFFLRWALGAEAKLPVEERARLLASPKEHNAEFFIAGLRGEKDRFAGMFAERTYHMWMPQRVVASHLRRELLGIPMRDDVPDLKPPHARPAMEIIREALAEREKKESGKPPDTASSRVGNASGDS